MSNTLSPFLLIFICDRSDSATQTFLHSATAEIHVFLSVWTLRVITITWQEARCQKNLIFEFWMWRTEGSSDHLPLSKRFLWACGQQFSGCSTFCGRRCSDRRVKRKKKSRCLWASKIRHANRLILARVTKLTIRSPKKMFEQEGLIYKRVYAPREQVLSEFRRVRCVGRKEEGSKKPKAQQNQSRSSSVTSGQTDSNMLAAFQLKRVDLQQRCVCFYTLTHAGQAARCAQVWTRPESRRWFCQTRSLLAAERDKSPPCRRLRQMAGVKKPTRKRNIPSASCPFYPSLVMFLNQHSPHHTS